MKKKKEKRNKKDKKNNEVKCQKKSEMKKTHKAPKLFSVGRQKNEPGDFSSPLYIYKHL